MSHIGYPSYKDTGTPWLGAIPNHWDIKPLWSMFKRQKRTGHQSERLLSVYRDYGVIPKDSRDDNANKASEDLSTYQLVKPGDLAINKMKAWQGSVAISSIQGIVSPAYFIFTPSHHALPKYLHYLFRCTRYIAGYLAISKGVRVGQWDMDPDHHSRMPVVLPPRKEQEEIADFLDRETARIDSLIEKKTRFIELLKEKRQAVITKAVTKGIDPSASMKDSGADWIGQVPAHWKSKRFKHNLKLKTDKADTRTFAIALEHIEGWSGRLIPNESEFDGDGTVFRKGDILFGKLRPYLAKVYLSETSGEAVGDIWVLRPIGGNSPEFLQYQLLNREFITTVNASTTGAKMPRADWEYVGSLPAPTPPLTEQVSIAEFLKRATTRIDQLIEKTKASIELLNEHRAALITAAVTGKIDVRKSK